jgi:hypothetical protein
MYSTCIYKNSLAMTELFSVEMLYHNGGFFSLPVGIMVRQAFRICISLSILPYVKRGNKVQGLESFLFEVNVREADCPFGPYRRSCLNQ